MEEGDGGWKREFTYCVTIPIGEKPVVLSTSFDSLFLALYAHLQPSPCLWYLPQ